MATRLDTTLASNLFTALAPRPDIAVGHGIKYWAQQVKQTFSDLSAWASRRPPAHHAYPPRGVTPGNAQAIGSPLAPGTGGSALRTLKCQETGRVHEQLPLEMAGDIADYHRLAQLSFKPTSSVGLLEGGEADRAGEHIQDAFRTHVTVNGEPRNILPDSLRNSSLLNARLDDGVSSIRNRLQGELGRLTRERGRLEDSRNALTPQTDPKGEQFRAIHKQISEVSMRINSLQEQINKHPTAAAYGKVQSTYPNTLYDSLSGFAASITVRNGNEVVIGFSGMGSQNGGFMQGVRGFMNAIGLTPPKNLAQASKLTGMVKAHLDELNRGLPEDRQLKLKLTGFSMGGGMATYAALRNEVDAVAISPMRLGLLARAKCGRTAITQAPARVTEVTVQGDWVASNSTTRGLKLLSVPSYLLTGRRADALGAIGHRYLIPKPTAEDRALVAQSQNWSDKAVEGLMKSIDVHVDFRLCLDVHRQRLEAEQPDPPPATKPDDRPRAESTSSVETAQFGRANTANFGVPG